jgi:glycine betaine/choline ABC-type transport system substrate-binding protein
MKVYILIETESDEVTYAYTEVFAKREDAIKRLETIYHEEVAERAESELIDGAWISDGHDESSVNYAEFSVHWQVQEKEVFE